MKTMLLIISLSVCSIAFGRSDFSVTWNVTGLQDGSDDITSVSYDLDIGTTYISAHGVVTTSSGLSIPSTGSCFVSSSDNIFCNLSFGTQIIVLDVGGDSLGGTIRSFDDFGQVDSGALTFLEAI